MPSNSTLKKLARRQGEAVITTKVQIGDKHAVEDIVERRQVVDDLPLHPATVHVSGGLTKNLGNYESARMSVSVSVPCDTDETSIRRTYKKISALVSELLDVEYDKVIPE